MWFIRVWKIEQIEQIEQIAAEQGKRPENIDAVSAEPDDDRVVSLAWKRSMGSVLKGFFMWTKV